MLALPMTLAPPAGACVERNPAFARQNAFPIHAGPHEQSWRAAALRPGLWPAVEFATHRDGSRRSELRRLLSLAAWAARYAGATCSLAISARLPADAQPTGLKAASAVALAAAGALQELSLTANRGFWPGEWLPRLARLRSLRLCSREGGLSLHGDLRALTCLSRLVLEAKHAVQLSDNVRCVGRQRGGTVCRSCPLPAVLRAGG